MSRATARKLIYWTLGLVGAAYPFYSWITQTGLYLWCADLSFTLQGNGPYTLYDKALLALAGVISWVAAAWLSGQVNRWLPLPAPAPVSAAEAAATAAAAGGAMESNIMRFLAIGSVVAIAVIGVTIHDDKSTAPRTFEPLNLANGNAPSSKYVMLTGTAMPSMEIRYRKFWGGYYSPVESDFDAYIPVLPPHWHPGDPVVYIFHPQSSGYLRNSPPVMIEQKGILLRDGLPGPAAFLFKKHGISLGTPPIVLDADVEADKGLQIGILIGCSIFLFLAAPFLILKLWLGWRESRRSSG